MSVTFELPVEIEELLRQRLSDLNQAAKESSLVEMYRQRVITRPQLSAALNLGRIETESLLNQHGVTEDLPSDDDTRKDIAHLRRLLDR
jgi:hypothetical protein